ncbi:hypothetical protein GCM10027416_32320 [Okibacterium endophyticum]
MTFTALAVLIALNSHSESVTAGTAALNVLVTTAGVLLAGFAADVISHAATHSMMPTSRQLQHMVSVSIGALGAIALPMLLFGLAALGVVTISTALGAGQVILAISLGAFALGALRRVRLTLWRRLFLAGILAGVGGLAILLEFLAHTL